MAFPVSPSRQDLLTHFRVPLSSKLGTNEPGLDLRHFSGKYTAAVLVVAYTAGVLEVKSTPLPLWWQLLDSFGGTKADEPCSELAAAGFISQSSEKAFRSGCPRQTSRVANSQLLDSFRTVAKKLFGKPRNLFEYDSCWIRPGCPRQTSPPWPR